MVNAPAPYGASRPRSTPRPDGGWDDGQRSGDDRWSDGRSSSGSRAGGYAGGRPDNAGWGDDSWSAATSFRAHAAPDVAREPVYDTVPERGLPGWGAVLLLIALAGVGGLIDAISGAQIRGGFNWGIIVASVVAILAVRRSGMFPVVIAPPIVYSIGSAGMLYVRSGGGHDRKVLFDAAANWLVYGFPAIAGATAAVLIIAGIRLIARR